MTITDDFLMERAKRGPHRGWDTFDIANEGIRMQRLHDIVSADVFDNQSAHVAVDELTTFAHGMGYADADSCLHAIAISPDSPVNEALRASVFDEPSEGDYFAEIRKSERVLIEIANTFDARQFLARQPLERLMLSAYEKGRDLREKDENSHRPTSRPTP